MSGPTEALMDEKAESFDNADYIILSASQNEKSEDSVSKRLDELWARTYSLSFWERFLSELFPSAFGRIDR